MIRRTFLVAAAVTICFSAAHAEDTLKIGGLLATSGPVASLGQPGLEGAELAVEQINAKGGINGKKLEFININTESDNTKAVTATKRLLQADVLAIVGPMGSGESFAITDILQASGTPMISNGGSRKIVQPAADKKWIFLSPLTNGLVQSVLMQDMKEKGITKIALLAADSPFGSSGREQLEANVAAQGITLVDIQTFGSGDKDMTPQLTHIRNSGAQATVVWATGPGQAIAVKNYRQLGFAEPIYLSHAANDFNFVRLAGESANGILLPSSKLYVTADLAASDPQKPVIETFVTDYEAKFGKPPATFAGNAYDALMMLAEALKTAGADKTKIRDAVEGLKDHTGVTAVYSYAPDDHFGAKADSVVMLTVKDGKFALAK
ncbi:ABC transporter substrate-binding protein [Agrobacterium vitis]|uniref:ABC transporter substrate-binding protein n=1 Tax=Agrobacterium vitis TaxID=373 RepID=UPI003D28A8E2